MVSLRFSPVPFLPPSLDQIAGPLPIDANIPTSRYPSRQYRMADVSSSLLTRFVECLKYTINASGKESHLGHEKMLGAVRHGDSLRRPTAVKNANIWEKKHRLR